MIVLYFLSVLPIVQLNILWAYMCICTFLNVSKIELENEIDIGSLYWVHFDYVGLGTACEINIRIWDF